LDTPWYAALGNHETIYNGGFGKITDELRAAAAGTEVYEFPFVPNGFRDGSKRNADVVTEGPTPADAKRVPQRLGEVLQLIHDAKGAPAGHGLDAAKISEGIGYFSVTPIEGRPLRLITLNSVNSDPENITVGAFGWIEKPQLDWLKKELAAAEAKRELVIVVSHHRSGDFSDSSPVTGEQLAATLTASPNVVLHITGHGHANRKKQFDGAAPARGYWELMLASTVDFPMQSRIIELVDEGNGFMTIYLTNLGHNSPDDSLAHEGRALAAAKLAFGTIQSPGDVAGFWASDVKAQNLSLRIELPSELQDELAKHDFDSRIESEETLAKFGSASGGG
jgi:3',5'-cyclic AMP phosphodiesterase CpdA